MFTKGTIELQVSDEMAAAQGLKDMALIKDKYLEFQKAIKDTCIMEVLAPGIKELAEYMLFIHCMLDGTAEEVAHEVPGVEDAVDQGREAVIELIKEKMKASGK
jgi:hypothetical protein